MIVSIAVDAMSLADSLGNKTSCDPQGGAGAAVVVSQGTGAHEPAHRSLPAEALDAPDADHFDPSRREIPVSRHQRRARAELDETTPLTNRVMLAYVLVKASPSSSTCVAATVVCDLVKSCGSGRTTVSG